MSPEYADCTYAADKPISKGSHARIKRDVWVVRRFKKTVFDTCEFNLLEARYNNMYLVTPGKKLKKNLYSNSIDRDIRVNYVAVNLV